MEFIGWTAFSDNTSLKQIHIPAKTRLEETRGTFYGISNCTSVTVDPGNPYYVAEDNMLFSKDKKELIFIAGSKEGLVKIPDYVETLPWHLFNRMPNLTGIEFSKNYMGDIPYQFVGYCPKLTHITFPDCAKLTDSESVKYCESLESLTLGRNMQYASGVHDNPLLKHIYLRNTACVNVALMLQRYTERIYDMNFYSDQTKLNAILDKCNTFYVPGGCKEIFDGIADCTVSEMWKYEIDRQSHRIRISPMFDDLIIDNVSINGMSANASADGMYSYESNILQDVVVDFTLHHRQPMTTHYDEAFNAAMPETIFAESVTLTPQTWSGVEGASFKIDAIVLPETATNKELRWSSSDMGVASVDQTGLVTVLKQGICTITASTTDGTGLEAVCQVDVLSGLDALFINEQTSVDVYNTKGMLMKRGCTRAELEQFSPGFYIVRSAEGSVTVLVK